MKERPILFNSAMVRALLGGHKTQTRRIVKPQFKLDAVPVEMGATNEQGHQIAGHSGVWWCDAESNADASVRCPYGQPGDRLWVRETFVQGWPCIDGSPDQFEEDGSEKPEQTWYRASRPDLEWDNGEGRVNVRWRPSIFMPRALSRILLEIVSVRVERLQAISEADAMAEGCTKNHNGYYWGGPHKAGGLKQMESATSAYRTLWESINGAGAWEANPWVWAVEFKVVQP